jgi:hypothetical protein
MSRGTNDPPSAYLPDGNPKALRDCGISHPGAHVVLHAVEPHVDSVHDFFLTFEVPCWMTLVELRAA